MPLPSAPNGHYNMTMKRSRRTIPAGEFKARCLALLDQVKDPLNDRWARPGDHHAKRWLFE
jgi:hypothetical protein